MFSVLFFFFFQAEDGIRDVYVTGVQTCALPISGSSRSWGPVSDMDANRDLDPAAGDDVRTLHALGYAQELARRMGAFSSLALSLSIICILSEIGRASCRERVELSRVAGTLQQYE